MYESSYGKGHKKGSEDGHVVPGSPDARNPYKMDMYDDMSSMSGYGKKVSTKKNTSGTGAPNTGIQGEGGGTVTAADNKGTGRTGGSSYDRQDRKPSVGQGDDMDYGKGRNKKRRGK